MKPILCALGLIAVVASGSAQYTGRLPAQCSRDPILQGPEAAECKTGADARIVGGIRMAESSGNPNPRHRIKTVKGAYGIDEKYHAERSKKYGNYDPLNPYDAAYITARLYMDNLKALRLSDFAVAAHLQGQAGVRRDGPNWAYVYRVMGRGIFADYKGPPNE